MLLICQTFVVGLHSLAPLLLRSDGLRDPGSRETFYEDCLVLSKAQPNHREHGRFPLPVQSLCFICFFFSSWLIFPRWALFMDYSFQICAAFKVNTGLGDKLPCPPYILFEKEWVKSVYLTSIRKDCYPLRTAISYSYVVVPILKWLLSFRNVSCKGRLDHRKAVPVGGTPILWGKALTV